MPSLTHTALELYRRFFDDGAAAGLAADGIRTVLDGNRAVAIAESAIAEDAVLGGSFPARVGDLVWRAGLAAGAENVFGAALAGFGAESPRGVVAAAIGLALAGRRTTAFLSGSDIAAVQDLMRSLAGQQLPVVLHLANRALPAHGAAIGSGHEAFHLSADAGCFTWFAANVQQAVDFTFIARHVAEQTLVPGLVVMDGEQTALSAQDLELLSLRQVRAFIGPAGESVPSPTAAQKLLFGERRRRVPCWHDLDRPVLNGALYGTESFALGAAARGVCLMDDVERATREALQRFARVTGRKYAALSPYRIDDAEHVFIVQGAALETVRAVVDYLRTHKKRRYAVLGVHTLRPFPTAELVGLLKGKKTVTVLERVDTPLAGDPPLLREIRAGLDRAIENGQTDRHKAPYALRADDRPVCRAAVYGLGGYALRAADLLALTDAPRARDRSSVYLGVAFDDPVSAYPKRAVLLDTLRRAYPGVPARGLKAGASAPQPRAAALINCVVQHVSGAGFDDFANDAAALLASLQDGHLRSLPEVSWSAPGALRADRFLVSTGDPLPPDDEIGVDLLVLAAGAHRLVAGQSRVLSDGAVVVLQADMADAAPEQLFDAATLRALRERHARVYRLPPVDGSAGDDGTVPDAPQSPAIVRERLLGGMCGALADAGVLKHKPRRIAAARKDRLVARDDTHGARLVEVFKTAFERVGSVEIGAPAGAVAAGWAEAAAPAAVRHLGVDNGRYSALPRFWDHVGVMYRDGETGRLTADPYLATGTIPPLSATFVDHSDSRHLLPSFDPTLCTGCGKCWTVCPDGALGVVAISPAKLIDTGIGLAGADALRQIAAQLAQRILSTGKHGEVCGATAGALIEQAAGWVADKMTLPEERRIAIEAGVAGLVEAIGALPVAVTEPFFKRAEQVKKDSAELLSIVVNPDACKACGLCLAVCEPAALTAGPEDAVANVRARGLWNLWAGLPDTASQTIERLGTDPDIGPMAATLLSRYCAHAVAGGDQAEPGSGEKIALRLALAATEYQQQPVVQAFSREVAAAAEKINGLIHETLAVSVPVGDLDIVDRVLEGIAKPHVDLATLTAELRDVLDAGSVDAGHLHRLIVLAEGLATLNWQLTAGVNGLGRARFGLAVAPGTVAAWAGAFPSNPFQAPVVIDATGDAPQIAAGLLEGQFGETMNAIRLLRQAGLEIDPPAGADWHRDAVRRLGWRDVDGPERRLCPPLILVGSDETLGGRSLSQVTWLLNSDLPVKILVFAELDFGLAAPDIALSAANDARGNLGLYALAQLNAYVAQTAICEPAHLHASVTGALRFDGPALVHVHTPSPARHGFAAARTLEQARLAVASRSLPLFRYDPRGAGVFGSRLDLAANPALEDPWVTDAAGEALTPVHWAVHERRFATRFAPLVDADPSPTEIADWLALDDKKRKTATPIVSVPRDGDIRRYRVAPELARLAAARQQVWRTLQELAGVVTPFTAAVEHQIRQTVAAEHAAELAAQQQASAAEIRQLRDTLQDEIAQKLRGQLLKLAGYRAATGTSADPG